MTSNTDGQNPDPDAILLPPGSEQYPAPRRGDPATHCSQCGATMTFNPASMTDGGTWTCTCEAGWAQQSRQLKWFIVMIAVLLMIAGLAV